MTMSTGGGTRAWPSLYLAAAAAALVLSGGGVLADGSGNSGTFGTSVTTAIAEFLFANPANLPTGLSGPVACPAGLNCGSCYRWAQTNGGVQSAVCCRCQFYLQNAPACDQANVNTYFSMYCQYYDTPTSEPRDLQCCWCQGGFSLSWGVATCAAANPGLSSFQLVGGSTALCLHGEGEVDLLARGGGHLDVPGSDLGLIRKAKVRDLKTGDRVRAVDDDGRVFFDTVYAVAHQDGAVETEFVHLTTASGRSVLSTPYHFLLTGLHLPPQLKAAQSVQVGEFLFLQDPQHNDQLVPDRVVATSRENGTGVYNPVTLRGSLLVNGLAVSAYADDVRPLRAASAHLALWPLRLLYQIGEKYLGLWTMVNAHASNGQPLWLNAYYSVTAFFSGYEISQFPA